MKKIFLLSAVVLLLTKATGQTLTIQNNSTYTGCDVTVVIYASAAFHGYPFDCNEFISNAITLTPGTTLSWCDPYNFQSGGGGTCGTGVGWATSPGGFLLTSMIPTSFQWVGATFCYSGCPTVACVPSYTVAGAVGDVCAYCSTGTVFTSSMWGSIGCPYAAFTPHCGVALSNATFVAQ
jgi:hypothetical protein